MPEPCPLCHHETHDGRCKHFITRIVNGGHMGTTRADQCDCQGTEKENHESAPKDI